MMEKDDVGCFTGDGTGKLLVTEIRMNGEIFQDILDKTQKKNLFKTHSQENSAMVSEKKC